MNSKSYQIIWNKHLTINKYRSILQKYSTELNQIDNWTEPRAPDMVHIFISIMPISSSKPMINYLLESSNRDIVTSGQT